MRKINSFSFQAAIQPGLVIRWFLRIAGILLVCHLLALTFFDWSWQWERLFSLDFENNLPTWFSSFLWLAAALFTYGCAQQILNVRRRLSWNALALFFLFLSCDEVASIHEHVGPLLKAVVLRIGIHETRDMRDWPFLLGPIAIIFCTWIGYQLRDEFRGGKKGAAAITCGMFLFLFGSMGVESLTYFIAQSELFHWTQRFAIVIEESFEMAGAILFNLGLLEHLRGVSKRGEISCQA